MSRHLTRNNILYAGFSLSMICIFHREFCELWDYLFLRLFSKTMTQRGLPIRLSVWILTLILLFAFLRLFLTERYANISSALIVCGTVALITILCMNQTMRRDDYWEAYDAMTHGVFSSVIYHLKNNEGRYTSWALKSLYGLFPVTTYIRVSLTFNYLLLCHGLTVLFRLVTEDRFTAVVCGMVGASGMILLASNTWEVWFWGAGMFIYGIGITLVILTAGQLLRNRVIPTVLLIFFTCGCSELTTASLIFFLLIMLCVRRDRTTLLFFIESLFCSLFSLLIGSQRVNAYANVGPLQLNAGWALEALRGFIWIRAPYWAAFFVFGLLIGFCVPISAKLRKTLLIVLPLSVLCAISILFINTLADYMPPRVVTVSISWVLIGVLCAALALGSLFAQKREKVPALLVCLSLLILTCCFYRENIGQMREIRTAWELRDAELRSLPNGTNHFQTCSIAVPGSFRQDLTEKPEDAPYIAQYYGLSELTATKPCFP